jgi:dTDP-4-amino-4,6-dideoxygalactose transaminase
MYSLIVVAIVAYLIYDYRGPKYINLYPINLEGENYQGAKELIVQEFDSEGNLWATRGMILYCLKKGEEKFIRIAHMPSGLSLYWLYNFKIFRWWVNKPECVVVTISGKNHICAMSGGFIWHSSIYNIKFKKTFKLRHFGLGIGRGIFNNGIVSVGSSQIFFGEYFRNSQRGNVRIYSSKDNGQSWNTAYEFSPGEIRHIHAVQRDPYTGRLWVCCGDEDNESLIGYSEDEFKSLHIIGRGSQMWRTCQLVFTDKNMYWGADTGSPEHSGIYCWDKLNNTVRNICKVKGAILFGSSTSNGEIVFSTDREGFENEDDDLTRLIVIDNDRISEIEIGTWKHSKHGYRFSFAMLRMQRTQGNNALCISVINQKEHPMGELLFLHSGSIKKLSQTHQENLLMRSRIYLSDPHMSGHEKKYINEAFSQNWIAPIGPNLDEFENSLSDYCQVKDTAALCSGTAAIHLALILLGVGSGDEVLVSTFTFSASVNPIVYQGGIPIFIDSEEDTWNMDPVLLENAIIERLAKGKKPKAIIVVHLYGMPAKIGEIMEIANRYNIPVIEDAAEALGSRYKGRPLGSFGKMGVLSFNGNKIITTSGGGALLSDDEDIIRKARFLATQARDQAPHYQHSIIGYNYRMSNVLAGIGRGQMHVLEDRIQKRRDNFYLYKSVLEKYRGVRFLTEPDSNYFSNYWLTTILLDSSQTKMDRHILQKELEKENIESRPLWKPMHLQPVFASYPRYLNGVSEKLFENGLCLPSGTNMSDENRLYILDVIRKAIDNT